MVKFDQSSSGSIKSLQVIILRYGNDQVVDFSRVWKSKSEIS